MTDTRSSVSPSTTEFDIYQTYQGILKNVEVRVPLVASRLLTDRLYLLIVISSFGGHTFPHHTDREIGRYYKRFYVIKFMPSDLSRQLGQCSSLSRPLTWARRP